MVNAMTSYAEARARYDTTYIRGVYASVEAASSWVAPLARLRRDLAYAPH